MRKLTLLLGSTALYLAPLSAQAQTTCVTYPELCNANVTSTIEQADLDIAIDVVLIGDGFTDAGSWQVVATGLINEFRTAPANIYGRQPGMFNFHVVDIISATTDVADTDPNDTALGMQVSGSFITANAPRINLAAMNAPDVDVVVAVANSSNGRANASYNTQLATGGVVRMRRSSGVITHELGHALFRLADEYQESALCTTQSEPGLLFEANVTTDSTCFKFQRSSNPGCIQGGKYCSTGIFRSASSCFMRSNNVAACPACSREIEDVLRERRSRADWAPPWPVASVPGGAGPVAGWVALGSQAHDDWFSPTRFSFELDGAFVGQSPLTNNSGRLDFDTSRLADGPHTLSVFAADAVGRAAAAMPIAFSTANDSDTLPPTVSISSPADGAQVSGWTNVFVQSTSSADLRDLVLFIDGAPVAAGARQTTLFYSWDTAATGLGTHVLTARGTDHSENVGLSVPITVTVNPATSGPSRAPMIQRPADGTLVGAWFALEWMSEGSGGVQGESSLPVTLIVDNAPVTPNPLLGRERSAIIDARTWALGAHQLRVRAVVDGVDIDSLPVLVVRGTPTTPQAFIRTPEAGVYVRGTVSVGLVGVDDAPLTSVSLLVNGTAVGNITGALGSLSWSTSSFTGCQSLEAVALSSDGGTGRSAPVGVCVDNQPPSAIITWPKNGATVAAGTTVVQASVSDVGSYVTRTELLVDGNLVSSSEGGNGVLFANLSPGPHALRVTAEDRAGHRTTSPSISVTVSTCVSGGCDDGDACTNDRCGGSGACVHARIPGCCGSNADCADSDACTNDVCSNGVCSHSAVAGCCNHNFDCDDGDDCTINQCSGPGGTCSIGPGGCCSSTGECNDGNSCTADACLGGPSGFCTHEWAPGCCASDADCNDGLACTSDTCSAGACTSVPVANCCENSSGCNDGVACTLDLCVNNVCQNQPRAGCCTTDADCTTLNPCSVGACSPSGSCTFSVDQACCNFDFECQDQDPCSIHACSNNACTLVSPTDGCLDAGTPMDASGPADADPGDPDAGASDASPGGDADVDEDLGVVRDGGERDAEASEVGAADGSEVGDAGRALDAEPVDALMGSDAQPAPDASRDAAVSATDASPMTDLGPSDSATDNAALKGGCGCSTPEGPRPAGSAAWMVLVALFVLRRRAGRRR